MTQTTEVPLAISYYSRLRRSYSMNQSENYCLTEGRILAFRWHDDFRVTSLQQFAQKPWILLAEGTQECLIPIFTNDWTSYLGRGRQFALSESRGLRLQWLGLYRLLRKSFVRLRGRWIRRGGGLRLRPRVGVPHSRCQRVLGWGLGVETGKNLS